MSWTRWITWLAGALLGAAALAGAAALWPAVAGGTPFDSVWFALLAGAGGAMLLLWAAYGQARIVAGDHRPAIKWAQTVGTTAVALAGVGAIAVASHGPNPLGAPHLKAALGVAAVGWAFALAVALARLLLKHGPGPLGVARTVLDEAIRMKVALVFIVLLLLVLPVLPFVLGADQPLRYRVQTFLSYSFTATGFLLAMMTIFLACATLSWEVAGRQIFTTAVKPIGRTSYLLGKWLGIIVLNAVLLSVAGVAIYLATVGYLAELPAKDAHDAMALNRQVLTARETLRPHPPRNLGRRIDQRLKRMQQQSPEAIARAGGEAAARRQIRNRLLTEWRSVGPKKTQVYLFDGLGALRKRWDQTVGQWQRRAEQARAAGRQPPPRPEPPLLHLRYKLESAGVAGGRKIPVQLSLNGTQRTLRMVVDTAKEIPVPAGLIDEDGRIELAVHNSRERNPTITFADEDGLSLLYKAGGFGANFARGMAIVWLKLAFLAMLGLAAATFLGFPVACVLSLLVYFIASASPFLLDSVDTYTAGPGAMGWINEVLGAVAWAIATLVRRFAAFSPGAQIVEGRLIGWRQVLDCLLWIGLIWTALAGLVGAMVFRRRELARVQV